MGRHCKWHECSLARARTSVYCAEHNEQARRNVLRALHESGADPRTALLWHDGDEAWLLAEKGV